MAFYFRKFRQSMRLLPATKSLGHSTWLNEGEKDGSICPKRYASSTVGQGEPTVLPVTSSSSSSALVPLSVRDMALVLLPRLDGKCEHPFDDLEPVMNIAKTVPLSCDDILVEHFKSYPNDKNTMLERCVLNVQNSDCDRNKSKPVVDNRTQIYHHPFTRLPSEVDERVVFTDNSCGSEKNFETLFLNDKQFCALDFDGFLFSSGGDKDTGKQSGKKDGASAEQLHSVKERLEKSICQLFTKRQDYSLLHQNVVFENNLFGDNRISRGQVSYALELLSLRFKIHARFSSTSMEVLNTTVNEDSGVIRIHWRLKGLPQTELLKFWRLFQAREEISKDDWQWFEAFSYFHIGKDGLVQKHRIDRMLPGGDEPDKLSLKLSKLLNPAKPLVN